MTLPSYLHKGISRAIALLLASGMTQAAMSQTDAIVAHYYEVPAMYNPAMTGTTDYARVRAGARMQWVGVANAPRIYALAADAPFRLGVCRMGGGAVVLKDTYGLYSSLQASAQLSLKLKGLGGIFSLALQAGVFNQRFNGSDVYIPDNDETHDTADPAIPATDVSGQAADLGLGVAFSRDTWHVALSCLHLGSPTISLGQSTGGADDVIYRFEAKRTLYFQAGCNIVIKNTLFEVIPSLIAATDFTFSSGVASVRMRYRGMFTAGIGYNYHDGVNFMLGTEIKNFYIGYSYGVSTSGIGKSSSGSHEAWLGYAFKLDLSDKTKHRHRSVRFM